MHFFKNYSTNILREIEKMLTFAQIYGNYEASDK